VKFYQDFSEIHQDTDHIYQYTLTEISCSIINVGASVIKKKTKDKND